MQRSIRNFMVIALSLVIAFALFGCEGDDGAQGPPGTSSGIVSGTVTNDSTGTPLAGVEVSSDPSVEGQSPTTTNSSGVFTLTLPTGNYTLTYSKTNFKSATKSLAALAGQTTDASVALTPSSGVVVDAGADVSEQSPGDSVNLAANIEILDGSSLVSIAWAQSASVPVTLINNTTSAVTVQLPGQDVYRDELFEVIANPPIEEDDLPENVPLPPSPFPGGLQDRFGVQAINPFHLEEAGLVKVMAVVTTTTGTYKDEVEIHADLPWVSNPGLRTVPINVPVLLHGKDQPSYDWELTAVPAGSSFPLGSSAFSNSTIQNPDFTPDAIGRFTVAENVNGVSFDIYSGTWVGIIEGFANDKPVWDSTCNICHISSETVTNDNDGLAPDFFAPWSNSGHVEIFTDNFNTSTHYSTSCFPCHTVGYNTEANSAGIDDQADYQTFLDQFTSDGEDFIANEDNYENALANTPDTARLTNIQCENCHGPQSSGGAAHMQETVPVEQDPRVSYSSDVCGQCHGEPARHARFQQWQLSGHANYELAIEEGANSDDPTFCGRCHTANGFIRWVPELLAGNPTYEPPLTWDADTVHPQTCPTCHEPHFPGNLSGEPNTATVRITNTTPMLLAGFSATGVGRGAICMTCHNTRRGLRNDNALPIFDEGRAPHGGAQTDVLMGQNAYFVTVGQRGPHSFLPDTCPTCHMVETPPPALLAYNLGGTNHTFFASIEICSDCHVQLDGEDLQDSVESEIEATKTAIESALTTWLTTYLGDGNDIRLTEATRLSDDTDVTDQDIQNTDTVAVSNFEDSHGRQAIDLTVTGSVNDTFEVQLRHIIDQATSDELFGPNDTATGFEESQMILKAGWNVLLIELDRSEGVHNPRFVFQVLGETQSRLAAADFSTITPLP